MGTSSSYTSMDSIMRDLVLVGVIIALGMQKTGVLAFSLSGSGQSQETPSKMDSLGEGNILRALDSLGDGNILKALDSLGHGHILKKMDSLGEENILRKMDSLGEGN